MGQFLTLWLEQCAKPKVRPKTFVSYEQLVRIHLAPPLGKVSLAKLTPQKVDAFLTEKRASGLSPRTVQYLHAVLRRALNQALKWDMVLRNVATLVESPKVPRREVTPYSPQETRLFLDAVKGDRLEAVYSVAIAIGLREGEALGLRWSDFDIENR